MTITHLFFDIGGVLGSNGWDREQRARVLSRFGIDIEDFQYRHEETIGDLESGRITLDEYLDVTVFCARRGFSRDEFKQSMFAESEPWPQSIAVARDIAGRGGVRLATLNNESAELNEHRISTFGLRDVFPVFFTSCWLGVRKPTHAIYARVLGMTQADPKRTVFIDDREQNLAPAAAMGVQTLLFQGADQLRRDLTALRLL